MKLLVLGGTVFLGKHIVISALEKGHEVTLFNRGKSRPEAFPEVEQIHGNRDGGLDALQGRKWDAAIDTCAYVPRVTRQSAEALAGATEHYTFISSVSVYKETENRTISESDPVGTIDDPTTEKVTGESYGPLKALCEQEVQAVYGDRSLIIRPGLIVGPDDISDRFTYWPTRFERGGEVLIPDLPDQPVQIIDVRDLAEWTVLMVENRIDGVFNAAGPEEPYLLGPLLAEIHGLVNPKATRVPVSQEFLGEKEVGAWMELPLYLGGDPKEDPMMRAEVELAIAEGLTFRSLEVTTRDTLRWAKGRPADYKWRAGLAAEREAELLRDWMARA
ncbi:MAG: NAD-dependent epimerase/dehydratase family protein [Fimbriimonas sp.]|nr:NAD-dependent epimerase/dehydratase family protein [Fimbriimonas sp.]